MTRKARFWEGKIIHSFRIRDLWLMKWPIIMLQKMSYFWNTQSRIFHFVLPFFSSNYINELQIIKNFIDVISPSIKIRISEECVLRNMRNIVILIIDMNLYSPKNVLRLMFCFWSIEFFFLFLTLIQGYMLYFIWWWR